jgi:hypothetical protein
MCVDHFVRPFVPSMCSTICFYHFVRQVVSTSLPTITSSIFPKMLDDNLSDNLLRPFFSKMCFDNVVHKICSARNSFSFGKKCSAIMFGKKMFGNNLSDNYVSKMLFTPLQQALVGIPCIYVYIYIYIYIHTYINIYIHIKPFCSNQCA